MFLNVLWGGRRWARAPGAFQSALASFDHFSQGKPIKETIPRLRHTRPVLHLGPSEMSAPHAGLDYQQYAYLHSYSTARSDLRMPSPALVGSRGLAGGQWAGDGADTVSDSYLNCLCTVSGAGASGPHCTWLLTLPLNVDAGKRHGGAQVGAGPTKLGRGTRLTFRDQQERQAGFLEACRVAASMPSSALSTAHLGSPRTVRFTEVTCCRGPVGGPFATAQRPEGCPKL